MLRIRIAARGAGYLRDKPHRVLGRWLLGLTPIPLDLRFVLRNMEPLRLRLGVLLAQIPGRASKPLGILGPWSPDDNAHAGDSVAARISQQAIPADEPCGS